jgi:cytochrome c oxidase accessory protein FixG
LTTKNIFELDPERLATTDEFGHRVYLYPEDTKGKWKNRKNILSWFLIVLYLVLPWIYVKGKPFIMVDIFNREFTLAGFTFHGVEPVLIFLFVTSMLFLIGFITSLYGRIWCGWACPQTVFIQNIFMKIEAFTEGKARKRREDAKGPLTVAKFFRKLSKWILFIIVSSHIAHTFFGYFIGPRELVMMSLHNPLENWGLFLATTILTLIFLLDFGWFREQFCIIACPYGRMQSVMMDENSLVVAYDEKRGEPRRNGGDCINCYNCVKVCPTGIDIRRGTQLECIACTHCIDACDEIMTKIKKPTGLIRYSSESELAGGKRNVFTLRSGVYLGVTVFLISLFLYFLSASTQLQLVFIRAKNPYQVVSQGIVMNQFTVKVGHQGAAVYKLHFESDVEGIQFVSNAGSLLVDKPEKKFMLFIRFPKKLLSAGEMKIVIKAVDTESKQVLTTKEVSLVGPVH